MPNVTARDGFRIAYDDLGSGPPLVLLHGTLGDRAQWRQAGYLSAFATIARVIAVDTLGHGASDRPLDPAAYGIPRHAVDVLDLLDALEIERATVWGWSLGGRAGFEIAARHPDRLVALIATAATGHGFSPYASAVAASSGELARAEGMRPAVEQYATLMDVPPWMVDNWAADDPRVVAAAAEANASWSGAEDAFEELAVPVLMLIGELDPLMEQARATAERVPRCVLVELEGCDHVSSFTASDVACALALEFLRDLWTGELISPAGDNPGEK